MAKLTCHCLNAAVHVKESTWRERAVDGARLFPANSGHRVVNATLYEVDLDVAGVTTKHSSLLLTHSIADWMVHTCSNCGNHVYITHREKNRVFVTGELMVDEAEVSQVKGHKYYSNVFQITLNPNLEEEEVAGRRKVSSMSFGRDDPAIKATHSRVKSYLALEEEEMASRIRAFERREKELFARLQQKTYRERTLLFAAIAKAKDRSKPTLSSSSSSSSTLSPTKPLTPHSSHTPSSQSHTHKTRVTLTLSDPRPLVAKRRSQPLDDALFSLDGFDEFGGDETDAPSGRGVAFPQSDDEEISTDDSSFRDLSSVQTSIASSVPLSIPMMKPPVQMATSPRNEMTLTDMATSIKALALSVQDTGMFGDLPRPRVNSDA